MANYDNCAQVVESTTTVAKSLVKTFRIQQRIFVLSTFQTVLPLFNRITSFFSPAKLQSSEPKSMCLVVPLLNRSNSVRSKLVNLFIDPMCYRIAKQKPYFELILEAAEA